MSRGSNGIAEQWVGLSRGSNGIAEQRIGLSRGSNGIAEQTIRRVRHSTLLQEAISTTLGDQRLGRGGNSIQGEERESDAEKGLAFHECVLRGVVVGSGADLTPRH
ncbi:hypothetical protein EMIT0347P_10649 [Pseudomonas sp. IT-347P]